MAAPLVPILFRVALFGLALAGVSASYHNRRIIFKTNEPGEKTDGSSK